MLPNKYSELRSIYKYHIDSYISLYQLKTKNDEELKRIYKMIKTNLIDSNKIHPQTIISSILNIIPYNNSYAKSYLTLAKLISDEYHVNEVTCIPHISSIMFYKEYGIKLDKNNDFEEIKSENIDIHAENTIYRAIIEDNKQRFILFAEAEEFNENQTLQSELFPNSYIRYSLIELCCYYGAVDCFKILRSKFNSEISDICLQFSFLGRNLEIISECLKYQKPDEECMKYAIISHSIDFVTFLMNEYDIKIDLLNCGIHNNLESFLVYFDQTNDYNKCFIYSVLFNIPSLCDYFLSLGANINEFDDDGKSALHYAAIYNSKEMVNLLISHDSNINEKDNYGKIALHFAAEKNFKEIAEILISHGANINEKDDYERTALHYAAINNCKEIVELLVSHGANINERDDHGVTSLHYAADKNFKDIVELLVSHDANINEYDDNGRSALNYAAINNRKEIVELLVSHGANINEKDLYGKSILHYAKIYDRKEIAEILISHGANVDS